MEGAGLDCWQTQPGHQVKGWEMTCLFHSVGSAKATQARSDTKQWTMAVTISEFVMQTNPWAYKAQRKGTVSFHHTWKNA